MADIGHEFLAGALELLQAGEIVKDENRAVAFTGGIGENSASLRAACLRGLEFVGIAIDAARNEAGTGDRPVSAEGSKVTVLALATNEELIVARRAYRCLVR